MLGLTRTTCPGGTRPPSAAFTPRAGPPSISASAAGGRGIAPSPRSDSSTVSARRPRARTGAGSVSRSGAAAARPPRAQPPAPDNRVARPDQRLDRLLPALPREALAARTKQRLGRPRGGVSGNSPDTLGLAQRQLEQLLWRALRHRSQPPGSGAWPVPGGSRIDHRAAAEGADRGDRPDHQPVAGSRDQG